MDRGLCRQLIESERGPQGRADQELELREVYLIYHQ